MARTRRAGSYRAYVAHKKNAVDDLNAMLDAYGVSEFFEIIKKTIEDYSGKKVSVMQVLVKT